MVRYTGWLFNFEQTYKDRIAKDIVLFSNLDIPSKEDLLAIYKPIWEHERELFGKLRPTFYQQVGDCTAAARKQSCEKQQIFDICVKRKERTFHPVFAPWLYGLARNQIMGGMSFDGATGAAIAEAQSKYGTLFEDDEDVPPYSGEVARLWGSKSNVNLERAVYYKYLPVAQNNKAKYVEIKTVDEIDHAILAGLFPIIGSRWGFRIVTKYGHDVYIRSTTWAHEMYFAARKEINGELYFFRHNSWGDIHNPNPKNGEYTGGAWQYAGDVELELKQKNVEVHAFIDFDEELGKPDYGII